MNALRSTLLAVLPLVGALSLSPPTVRAQVATRDNNLAMGNPSGATKDEGKPENYLVERDQYALSYNKTTGRANWVSWHLSTAWLGHEKRSKIFFPDTGLPNRWFLPVSFQLRVAITRSYATPWIV